MKRLIVLDLDNTLLNSKGEVSDYSKMGLRKYEELGHMVVLTSQKNYGEMNILHHQLGLKSPIITEGGSELYFFNDKIKDIVMSIDKNIFLNIFRENDQYIKSAFYHYKTNLYLHKRMDILMPLYGINSMTHINENNFLEMDLQFPNMVFTVVDINYLDKFKENMKKYDDYIKLTPLGQDLTVALFYMNIKNVNKAYAILELLLHVDYEEKDLIVVGDSIKDVEMLKLNCDTAAMINGEIEAKEAAKEITEYDNNHDGACKYVNKILGLNI